MKQPRLVDMPFTEVAQLIRDQRDMVEDEIKIQKILDDLAQAEQDRFIVSLNQVR